MKKAIFIILGAFLIVAIAQETRMEQSESLNRRRELQQGIQNSPIQSWEEEEQAPEIIPGDRNDLGPQYLVKRKKVRRWVDLKFDTQSMYTSNMLLQADGWNHKAVDVTLLVSTAEFVFAPDPITVKGNPLIPKIGFRHQWFNYALGDNGKMFRYSGNVPQDDALGYNRFDFDSQTVFGSLDYVVSEKWFYGLKFEFTRLLGHETTNRLLIESRNDKNESENYSEFYKEYAPSWTAGRFFTLTPISTLVVSYEGKLHLTDAENRNDRDFLDGNNRRGINNRFDSILSLSVKQQIVPTVFAQPFFKLQYTNFNVFDHRNGIVDQNRDDFIFTMGSSFSWEITDWFSVNTFGSFEKRLTTADRIDEYTKYDLGGGLSANFRF